MDPQAYDRWLEVSFYYFCQDILKTNNEIMDVMDLVEALAPLGKYEVEPVKNIVQEVMIMYHLLPTREELALLLYHNGIQMRKIKRYTKMGLEKLYKIIEEDKNDPRAFYPRLDSAKLALINKFMETVSRVRKAGLHND